MSRSHIGATIARSVYCEQCNCVRLPEPGNCSDYLMLSLAWQRPHRPSQVQRNADEQDGEAVRKRAGQVPDPGAGQRAPKGAEAQPSGADPCADQARPQAERVGEVQGNGATQEGHHVPGVRVPGRIRGVGRSAFARLQAWGVFEKAGQGRHPEGARPSASRGPGEASRSCCTGP